MGFEDEKDPANEPTDREEYESWEADRAARKQLRDAAPDLLAACQAFISAYDGPLGDSGLISVLESEISQVIRAAIAKAVEPGGTP